MKVRFAEDAGKTERLLLFWCPGCDEVHPYRVESKDPAWPRWQWNGDQEKPTLTPSLLIKRTLAENGQPRCHLFLTDGRIQFCGDSEHALAGQTVDLPDFPEDW